MFEVFVDGIEAVVENFLHFRAYLVERDGKVGYALFKVVSLHRHLLVARVELVVFFNRVVVDGAEHCNSPFEVCNSLTCRSGIVIFFLFFKTAVIVLAVLFGNTGLQIFEIAVNFLQS